MKAKKVSAVLIAHGSRINEANEEVVALASVLGQRLDLEVIPCFLEIATPDIPTGIDQALQADPHTILILPYFLTQGRHVQEDLPKLIAEKARAYPEVQFKLADYLGKQETLVELLAKIVQKNL